LCQRLFVSQHPFTKIIFGTRRLYKASKASTKKTDFLIEKITDENQLLVLKTIQEFGQPINIDKIVALTKLEPQVINQSLAFLIIQGIIKETEKGYTI